MELTEEQLNKLIDARVASHVPKVQESTPPPSTPSLQGPKSGEPTIVPHQFESFMKTCTNCDEPNPDYKKPNVFCEDCGMPLGTTDKPVGFEGDLPDIKPCKACRSTQARVRGGK